MLRSSRLLRCLPRASAVAFTALAFVLVSASPALADTASLRVTDAAGKDDPVVGVGRTFTVSGNVPVPRRLYTKFRAPGGAPCAPSADSDAGTHFDPDRSSGRFEFYGSEHNGNFSVSDVGIWQHAGTLMFCYWLADSATQAVKPITQMITFRQPTATISGVVDPAVVQPEQSATLTITGASEVPISIYATLRSAGGAPCAQSASADAGTWLGDSSFDRNVDGAFTRTLPVSGEAPGTYLICLWLAGSSTDAQPIAGPQPVTFTVAAPPPPPPPPPPPGPFTAKLELARATINRRDRVLDVLAPITSLASGVVHVELHAAGRRYRFTAPVNSRDGRIRFRQRIPKAQANLGTGILTITYPGDADTRPQTVRLRAASQRADLRLSRPTIADGRLRASGTISSRARGVVRVQIEYVTGGQTTTLQFNARVGNGRWSLNQALAPNVLSAIAQRSGTVHSYTLFTGYLPRRIRGEMRSFQVLGPQ